MLNGPLPLVRRMLTPGRDPKKPYSHSARIGSFPTAFPKSLDSCFKMTVKTALTNIFLIGAGGTAILNALTSEPCFTVSILTRTSSKSTFPSHLTVHRVSDNYPESQLLSALKGQDAIVVAISSASEHKQKDFIDAAVKAGVKRFVPSEFGGHTENQQVLAVLPQPYGKKREVVDYL